MASGLPCPACRAEILDDAAGSQACPHCGVSLLLCGHYQVYRLLGRGGMGAVYAARDQRGGEEVAAKVLWLGEGADWKGVELFGRGARVLQALSHPALPRVLAVDEGGDHPPCLVRERFDGGSLESRVRAGQRVDAGTLRSMLVRLLELLAFLHGQNPPVLHRDLKPSNIMFRTPDDWDPVLVDFDTVASAGPQEGRVTIVCSPGYTAPEQLAGQVSPASDLYSLGATMLFVATGQEPDHLARADGRLDVGAALDHLDRPLRRALLALVELSPTRRPRSAAQALHALGAAAEIRAPGEAFEGSPGATGGIDALAARGRAAEAARVAREGQRLARLQAAQRTSLTYRAALATSRWHLLGSWAFHLVALAVTAMVFLTATPALLAILRPPGPDLGDVGFAVAGVAALQLVLAPIAILRSRTTLRQTRAWLDALPFEVRGYLDLLGRSRVMTPRIYLRLEFMARPPELTSVVAALTALDRRCQVQRQADRWGGAILEVTTLRGLWSLFTNRAVHTWFERATAQVLLEVHHQRGALRFIDLACEEEGLRELRG